jgi:WD40 repeat protein/tRNA A-37 threonylcarbamoyl transferase component Bud32
MSYCLNPVCRKPENPDDVEYCQSCRSSLLLKDRYRAIKPIGQGGFGKTFLAVDEDMPSKPQCVIKQFFNRAIRDETKAEELFRQEAKQLEQLGKHYPQIPELLAHFELGSGLYLVQEFIDGQNLLEELKQEGAFDETKIWQLLNDLLPVLQFIHSQRIIHRDIKPENIIRCQQDSRFVLVDFGVSKFVSETGLGSIGTVIGTPGYAAPEQWKGKAFFSSDLYSLGITCFHLLTRQHPEEVFTSPGGDWEKYIRIIRNNLNQKKDISHALKGLITKLLQPDISQRYQSAEEVLRDLNLELTQATSESSLILPVSVPMPRPQIWKCLHTISVPTYSVRCVAISPDGQTLASGEETPHKIRIWNLHTGKPCGEYVREVYDGKSGDVWSITFCPDGETLVSSGWGDGKRSMANKTQKTTIQLLNFKTGEVIRYFPKSLGAVSSVAISPDGQILASDGGNATVKLWNLHTGKLLDTLPGHSKGVWSVAISPDGQTLASGSEDKTIKLWNLPTRKFIDTLSEHSESVHAVAISPDSQILASGSEDNTVKLWNIATRQRLRTLSGHSGRVNSVAFSPDGQILASGSEDDTIRLWQVETGELLSPLPGESRWEGIWSVAFSPDGQILASGIGGGTIKIWQRG